MAVTYILYALKLKRWLIEQFNFKLFFFTPLSLFSNNRIRSSIVMVKKCIVTMQSQICGALTFSAMIFQI